MNERTSRWSGNVIGAATIAAFSWLVWGWWSFSGPYRLLAHLELSIFGNFGAISTFALGVVLIGGLATLALRPSLRRQRQAGSIQRRSPAVAKAMTERAIVTIALGVGACALVVALAAGGLLYRDAQRDAVPAELDLSSGRPLPPGAGRIRLLGFTRQAMSIGVESRQTPGVSATSTAYMAVVGPGWRPGQPVPVVVQGSPGLGLSGISGSSPEPGEGVPFDLASGFVRSFMSGYAADLLAQRGAIVDRETLVLDTRPDAERDALLPVVVLGGLVAALGIFGGLIKRRSLARASARSEGRSAPLASPLSSNAEPRTLALQVREVNHGASGGSYVCIFEAIVEVHRPTGVKVTVDSVVPANAAMDLVVAAKDAIRKGADDALSPLNFGASIHVSRLVIHDIDFKPMKFRTVTARELRRLIDENHPRF